MKLTLWSCDVFFWLDGFWKLNHQVGEKMKHSKHRNLMFEHFATVVLLYSLVKDLLLPAFAQFFGASFKSSMSKPAVAVARCNRPTPSWRRKSRRCRCLTAPDWTNECQPSRVGLFQRKVCFSSITVSGYIHDFSDLEMLTKNRYSPSIHHPREPKYNWPNSPGGDEVERRPWRWKEAEVADVDVSHNIYFQSLVTNWSGL